MRQRTISRYAPLPCLLALLLFVSACASGPLSRLVGGNRDDHGCLGAAGYTWSEALHQCIRVWEVAERMEQGNHTAFVLFTADSSRVEVFSAEGSVVCLRNKANPGLWAARKGKERLTLQNSVMTLYTNSVTYTKEVRP